MSDLLNDTECDLLFTRAEFESLVLAMDAYARGLDDHRVSMSAMLHGGVAGYFVMSSSGVARLRGPDARIRACLKKGTPMEKK